jgi:hypothetical protein
LAVAVKEDLQHGGIGQRRRQQPLLNIMAEPLAY